MPEELRGAPAGHGGSGYFLMRDFAATAKPGALQLAPARVAALFTPPASRPAGTPGEGGSGHLPVASAIRWHLAG